MGDKQNSRYTQMRDIASSIIVLIAKLKDKNGRHDLRCYTTRGDIERGNCIFTNNLPSYTIKTSIFLYLKNVSYHTNPFNNAYQLYFKNFISIWLSTPGMLTLLITQASSINKAHISEDTPPLSPFQLPVINWRTSPTLISSLSDKYQPCLRSILCPRPISEARIIWRKKNSRFFSLFFWVHGEYPQCF